MRRRWCAWGGVLAVLIQLAVPLGQGIPVPAFAGGSDDNTLTFFVCTAMGKLIETPEKDVPGAPGDQTAPCMSCLVCQIQSLCQKRLSGSAVAVSWFLGLAAFYPKYVHNVRVSGWDPYRHPPRAPPSFT